MPVLNRSSKRLSRSIYLILYIFFLKKSYTCEEGGAYIRISVWHLLMNFEKPEKSEFWKKENICWRYYHFTHVYQKPRRRQNFLSFWAIFCPFTTPFPLQPKKPKFWKMKKTSGNVIISNILNLCNKKYDHMKQSAKDKHFRPFFALLPHYWPRKLKFGKM